MDNRVPLCFASEHKQYAELRAKKTPENAMERLLTKAADPTRRHPLYNTSKYTFASLLDDSENIAPNLVTFINGFSATARTIFEKFKFADQIEKLDASRGPLRFTNTR